MLSSASSLFGSDIILCISKHLFSNNLGKYIPFLSFNKYTLNRRLMGVDMHINKHGFSSDFCTDIVMQFLPISFDVKFYAVRRLYYNIGGLE